MSAQQTYAERAIDFACEGEKLFGVLALPAVRGASELGVVVVVGGPQYRAGSHRQFVLLARAIAAAGHPCLRFDYRGMGDSAQGASAGVGHFESVTPDIAAALDALGSECPTLKRFVLWGLCDGASAVLLHAAELADPRVCGAVLVNPWVRTEQSRAQARVRHYYGQRLLQPAFWRKLFSGKISIFRSASEFLQGLRQAHRPSTPDADLASNPTLPYPLRMAQGWRSVVGPKLLILSGQDLTAREFEVFSAGEPAWADALRMSPAQTVTLVDADHTCSQHEAESGLHRATIEFLARLAD